MEIVPWCRGEDISLNRGGLPGLPSAFLFLLHLVILCCTSLSCSEAFHRLNSPFISLLTLPLAPLLPVSPLKVLLPSNSKLLLPF